MLSQTQIIAKYGTPNKTGAGYLTTINLPYPMRISWDMKGKKATKLQCHKLIAPRLLLVFNDLLKHYGYAELVRLQIDVTGGCFNYRVMRGGSELSRHSWGIAIDLDPLRNQLKENHTTARFARPEYDMMHKIFYKHGFFNLGKEKDYDWMHYESAI